MDNSIILVSSKKIEDVFSLELLKIEYLDIKIELDEVDLLIITSKHSLYALENLKIDWKQKALYLISDESAEVAKKLGAKVEYISKSAQAKEFANELIGLIKDKKALFVRGKDVAFDIKSYLREHEIEIKEAIIYKSTCKKPKTKKLPKEARFFIFGSPKNLKCFLKYFSWHNHYIAVSLGTTTANSFPKGFKYIISPYKSIQKTITFLKEGAWNL